jgi:hypothetical protein
VTLALLIAYLKINAQIMAYKKTQIRNLHYTSFHVRRKKAFINSFITGVFALQNNTDSSLPPYLYPQD